MGSVLIGKSHGAQARHGVPLLSAASHSTLTSLQALNLFQFRHYIPCLFFQFAPRWHFINCLFLLFTSPGFQECASVLNNISWDFSLQPVLSLTRSLQDGQNKRFLQDEFSLSFPNISLEKSNEFEEITNYCLFFKNGKNTSIQWCTCDRY